MNKPAFCVGYDGETEYKWNGKRWAARHHQPNTQIDPDMRLVGCVYGCYDNRHDYPPMELMAHFPGYTRARYKPTGEKYPLETTCGTLMVDRCEWEFDGEPQQVLNYRDELLAKAWRDELIKHYPAVAGEYRDAS